MKIGFVAEMGSLNDVCRFQLHVETFTDEYNIKFPCFIRLEDALR